jgi:hypothetical protein
VAPDLRIDWDDVCRNPDDFERVVKLLLQRLHPYGEVIDGRGGDGGREFQVRTPDSLLLYEAKSFTGRVSERSPKRRAQVERSLVSAARHQPNAWHLVVPIDHNPDELNWFDGLRNGDFPFIGHWRGQTWLEEQLAQHDDLVRYATADKLLEYVRLYKIETEALAGGVPDLLRRQRALTELGDTISPHWRPVVGHLEDGTPVVSLQAKHPGAADEAPITFRMSAAIPVEPATEQLREQVRDSIDFGTTVEIPGNYLAEFTSQGPPGLGLPGPDSVIDRVVLGEIPQTVGLPAQTIAVYRPGAAFPISSLDFHAESATQGQAGVRVFSFDTARALQLVTEFRRDGALQLNIQSGEPGLALPAALVPGLRLLRAMVYPNVVWLTVRRDGRSSEHDFELEPDAPDDGPPEEFLDYLENLAAIQDALHQPFPVSRTVTRGERELAQRLRRMLAGEVVPWLRGPIRITLDADRLHQFKQEFPAAGGWFRISYDDLEVTFGERTIHTGPLFMIGAVTLDLDALPDESPDGADVPATLEVIGDGWFHAQRGVPEDPPGPAAKPLPVGEARVSYSADQFAGGCDPDGAVDAP